MTVWKALRRLVAAMAVLSAVGPAAAYDPDPPRDPRAIGLSPISIGTRGDEVVRVERGPGDQISRCVRVARLATPDEGGPSRLEFGVERGRTGRSNPAGPTMYFCVQYLDGPNGKSLPVRDPVLEIRFIGPTNAWHLETMDNGWIRRSKSLEKSERSERVWFANEVEKPGNGVVSTFPDGTHRMHHLRGGVSPRHFEMFFDCVCALLVGLPKSATDGFPCRELKHD